MLHKAGAFFQNERLTSDAEVPVGRGILGVFQKKKPSQAGDRIGVMGRMASIHRSPKPYWKNAVIASRS